MLSVLAFFLAEHTLITFLLFDYANAETLFEILLRVASKHDSIEQTTKSLTGSPTGNAIHYHLDKLDNMLELEQQINAALQSRLPSGIGKKNIAWPSIYI